MPNLSDSELIALYHEGKLDGESMNLLERRALDDPFLADALEGFSHVRKPHIVIKKDLKERLDKRLHKSKRRSIIGQTASWAAAAAIVLAVGATWFWFHEEKENQMLSADAKLPIQPPAENNTVKEAPPAETPQIAAAPPQKPLAKEAPAQARPQTIKQLPDSVILGDVAIVSYGLQQKKDIAASVAQPPADNLGPKKNALQKELSESSFALARVKTADSSHVVKGRVLSTDDGAPLPGVNLVLQGKKTGVVTNARGEFSLTADSGDVLDARYVGYQNARKKVTKTDSLIIAMQPVNTSADEAVVLGYGTQKPPKKAEPVYGWKAYREYLEEKSGSGSGGKVVLEFSIDETGVPSDFIVVKTANEKLAERAKEIVLGGAHWKRGTQATERVRLTLKFK